MAAPKDALDVTFFALDRLERVATPKAWEFLVRGFVEYAAYRFALSPDSIRRLAGALSHQLQTHTPELQPVMTSTLIGLDALVAEAQAEAARHRPSVDPLGRIDRVGAQVLRLFYESELSLREAGSFTRALLDYLRARMPLNVGEVVAATPVVALLLRRVGQEAGHTPLLGMAAVRVGGRPIETD